MRANRALRIVILLSMLIGSGQSGAAYEGDHYPWTYYLALHCGYTERQAFQVASATYAIDWDPETGPMGTWGDWADIAKNSPSQQLRDIWVHFHAFEETTNPPLSQDQIEAVKQRQKERLWDLAVAERNPGPLIHFVQDYQAHYGWGNVRGHAVAGHTPDFLLNDLEAAWMMTKDTLTELVRFKQMVLHEPAMIPVGERLARIRKVFEELANANQLPSLLTLNNVREAPNLFLSLPVVAQAVEQDQTSGLLPRFSPKWTARLPPQWIRFGFDSLGNINERREEYAVEQLQVAVQAPRVQMKPTANATVIVDVEVPYVLSGAAWLQFPDEEMGRRPLPVAETHTVVGVLEPKRLQPGRETTPERAPHEFVARARAEIPARALAAGDLVWIVGIQPFGLAGSDVRIPLRPQ